jgi:hypothetical protein
MQNFIFRFYTSQVPGSKPPLTLILTQFFGEIVILTKYPWLIFAEPVLAGNKGIDDWRKSSQSSLSKLMIGLFHQTN